MPTQKIFARSSTGKVTEIQTLTPIVQGPVTPNGTVTGTLAEEPATYSNGDTIQLGANFANGSFPVTFYEEGPADTWTPLGTVQSNSSGNAYFKTYEVDGSKKVFARKTNNDRTEVDTIAPSPKVTLDILRDCPTNDCATTATASGVLDPSLAEGVPVTLQYPSGSSWVTDRQPGQHGRRRQGRDPVLPRRREPVVDPHLPPRGGRRNLEPDQVHARADAARQERPARRRRQGCLPGDDGNGVHRRGHPAGGRHREDDRRQAGEVRRARQLHGELHQEAVQAEVPRQAAQRRTSSA